VKPHVFMSVPSHWEKLATPAMVETDPAARKEKLLAATGGRLRFCLSGGAGLKKEVKEVFYEAGVLVIEGYGLTESSPTLTLNRPNAFRFDSVGKALPSVQLKLAEDGEILARGPNVFAGYHKDEAATKEIFTDDGWLKTGDVGRFTEDGFLQIVDRKKDILVTAGGKNVPPANIEMRFAGDPYIAHAVVYGDAKKFLVVALWPNEAAITEKLGAWDDAAAKELLEASVARVNTELASYESLKKHPAHGRRRPAHAEHEGEAQARVRDLQGHVRRALRVKRLLNLLALGKKTEEAKARVGTTPADVVFAENKWKLLRYRTPVNGSTPKVRHKTPILLVPSLINRHYVLDLMPGKSFAEWLVGQGFDVFCIDWGTPEDEDRFVTFDDVCDRWIGRAIKRSSMIAGTEKVHLLGYCLGGTLTTIHAAVHPEKIASMCVLAAPVSFGGHAEGLLEAWTRNGSFDVRTLVDATGNVPHQLLQAAFHMLRPTLTLSKAVHMIDKAWDDEFLDGFLALERWGSDNVSFPGECYARYIEELYQKDALANGTFTLLGRPAKLENVTCPLLSVTFEHDNIVPKESAAPLLERAGSKDKTGIHLPGGHVGAVVSRAAAKRLWPVLAEFFVKHDEATPAVRKAIPPRKPRESAAPPAKTRTRA
jgi:polyhydroxyalkanoate synthase subunit PhaC